MPHRSRSQRPFLRAVAVHVGEAVVAVAPVSLPGAPGRRLGDRGRPGARPRRASQATVLAAVTDAGVHLFTCRVRAGRPSVVRHLESWDRRSIRVEAGVGRRSGLRVEWPTWGRVVLLRPPDVSADDGLADVVGFCFQVLATTDERSPRTDDSGTAWRADSVEPYA